MDAPQRASSQPQVGRKPFVYLKDRMAKFNPIVDLICFVWGIMGILRS